jgi:hypothetical protein
LVFDPVKGIGCVVTTTTASEMVRDTEKIVDVVFSILCLLKDIGL